MDKSLVALSLVVYALFLFPIIFHGGLMVNAETYGTEDGSEKWGYVEVRPGFKIQASHGLSFFGYRVDPSGSSGVGIGNFQEIGPLDTNLKTRDSTWLKKADLLFVDSPVGTGYSYVENASLLVKTDEEAAADLTTLLIDVFNRNESLQKSPLYIVGESYGGKHAVTLGLSALQAIKDGKLNAKLGGVVLGDSWISPEDYAFTWGPLLNDLSRLDNNCLDKSNWLANRIKQRLEALEFRNAYNNASELGDFISNCSNYVNFYNFLLDSWTDPLLYPTASQSSQQTSLRSTHHRNANLTALMNGKIMKKLDIIPQNHTWESNSDNVSDASAEDFMRPRINEVDLLLSKGVDVTIYNGQLDLLCSTKGTEAWVEKLK
ncbi:serine carboxypeptidase-like 51 [Phtheirospermum japonicum]|uniref:Carboxypeptidase n=1 Tax=Phtheirospermum japonicum TaxID=374723 RepID=A0A830CBZ4_9LAMI|nr:serine carboxypeptidase-like 51 [Phtheirospermum japonicum]